MLQSPRSALVAAIGLAIPGLLLALRILPYQLDDAYIAYRYAANLAAGFGATFNPGFPPVEGFTSPAWCLALAVVARAFGAAALPVAASAAGVTAWLLCVIVAVASESRRAEGSALAATAILATLPTFVFYSVTGLETALFGLIVLAVAAGAAGELSLVAATVAAGAALAVRPESGFLPMLLLVLWCTLPPESRAPRRGWLLLLAALVAGAALLLSVRLVVFGRFLPHTFHAKPADWSFGWSYVVENLSTPHGATLLILALVGGWLAGARHRGYLLAGASWLPVVILEGGDWMPAGRFLLPTYVLWALAAAGLATPVARRRLANRGIPRVAALVAALFALLLALQLHAAWREGDLARSTTDGIRREAEFIADWTLRAGARSAAAVDIGWLGFRTGVEIVDLGGLTDPAIGSRPGGHLEKAADPAYVVSERNPDLIVIRIERLPERGADGKLLYHPISGIERAILGDPGFADEYRLIFTLVPEAIGRRPFYGKLLFAARRFSIPEAARTGEVIQLSSDEPVD